MGLDLDYIDGQTPLDEDDKESLLIPTVTTRGELDEFEQLNIEEALQWVIGKTLFSWGTTVLSRQNDVREIYIQAIKMITFLSAPGKILLSKLKAEL
jgi:hypothetical protein